MDLREGKGRTDRLGKLVGVSAEGIDVANRSGGSSITEQHREGVDPFLVVIMKTRYG